jgi:hypothetical protein
MRTTLLQVKLLTCMEPGEMPPQGPCSGLSLIDLSPAMGPVGCFRTSIFWADDDFLRIDWPIHVVDSCNLGTEARAEIEMDDLTLLTLPLSLLFKDFQFESVTKKRASWNVDAAIMHMQC